MPRSCRLASMLALVYSSGSTGDRPLTPAELAAVMAVAIKIDAVVPGMGEDTVKQDADALFLRAFAQMFKIFHRTQDRVRFFIVGGIVAMIGACLYNGIQIEAADTQIFEIRQL